MTTTSTTTQNNRNMHTLNTRAKCKRSDVGGGELLLGCRVQKKNTHQQMDKTTADGVGRSRRVRGDHTLHVFTHTTPADSERARLSWYAVDRLHAYVVLLLLLFFFPFHCPLSRGCRAPHSTRRTGTGCAAVSLVVLSEIDAFIHISHNWVVRLLNTLHGTGTDGLLTLQNKQRWGSDAFFFLSFFLGLG